MTRTVKPGGIPGVCCLCGKATANYYSRHGLHEEMSGWYCGDCLVQTFIPSQHPDCFVALGLAGPQAEVAALLKRLSEVGKC
jgi:hypothetical protein